jgi:hypothetical protein
MKKFNLSRTLSGVDSHDCSRGEIALPMDIKSAPGSVKALQEQEELR